MLAGFGKSLDQLREDRRIKPLGADVIEEKQRARADYGDIVDAMVDEILPYGVMTVHREAQL